MNFCSRINKLSRGQIFLFSLYFRKAADAKVPDGSSNSALHKLSAIGCKDEWEQKRKRRALRLPFAG